MGLCAGGRGSRLREAVSAGVSIQPHCHQDTVRTIRRPWFHPARIARGETGYPGAGFTRGDRTISGDYLPESVRDAAIHASTRGEVTTRTARGRITLHRPAWGRRWRRVRSLPMSGIATETSAPLPSEPSSRAWLYHSHASSDGEINLGLLGFIVVTDARRARADGALQKMWTARWARHL